MSTISLSHIGIGSRNLQGELEHFPIGEVIRSRYSVPVVLENDLNAIAIGRCYLKSFPKERCENVNMAYIHFDTDCLSAGFLSNGKVLRGWNNFVGELGLFPMEDNKILDEVLASPIDEAAYAKLVAGLITGICCVLNQEYIALGGIAFRKDTLPIITECFNGTLPSKMSPEILSADDKWPIPPPGISSLTCGL